MLRLPSELIRRMVLDETPTDFTLYNEERLSRNDRRYYDVTPTPYYANNWERNNEVLPRLTQTLDHIKPIECMQDYGNYSLSFETDKDEAFFSKVAQHFERHSRRCPDTELGLSLLVASFTDEMPDPYPMLRMLEIESHSKFGCHVVEMDYADQAGTLKVEFNESLVLYGNSWDEIVSTPSIRIPLLRKDGCPFHAIALLATFPAQGEGSEDQVIFEFVVQLEQGMPWSLLTHADYAPNRVADYVRRYGRRKTVLKDHNKPFK